MAKKFEFKNRPLKRVGETQQALQEFSLQGLNQYKEKEAENSEKSTFSASNEKATAPTIKDSTPIDFPKNEVNTTKQTEPIVQPKTPEPTQAKEEDTNKKRGGRGRTANPKYADFVKHTINIRQEYLEFFQSLASLVPTLTLTDVLDLAFNFTINKIPEEDKKQIEKNREMIAKFKAYLIEKNDNKEVV